MSNISKVYKTQWKDRVAQFGVGGAIRQLFSTLYSPVLQIDRQVVLVSGQAHSICFPDDVVILNTVSDLYKMLVGHHLAEGIFADKLKLMLLRGNRIYAIVKNKTLAGYACTQINGQYSFGPKGWLKLPKNQAVFKNLYVSPSFRRQKIGITLNKARLAGIGEGQIGIVFVMKENKVAIRNWLRLGFIKEVGITQFIFFCKYKRYGVVEYKSSPLSKKIIQGLV